MVGIFRPLFLLLLLAFSKFAFPAPASAYFSVSAEFIVQLEFAPSARLQSLAALPPEQLALRLATICGIALERAMDRHLFGRRGGGAEGGRRSIEEESETGERRRGGETRMEEEEEGGGPKVPRGATEQPFRVRLLGLEPPSASRPFARLRFVGFLQGRPIPAQALVRDLSLLSLAELSAILQFPVLRLDALVQSELAEQAQWWLIALIASGGLLLIGCAWALLFCWLNICLRREETNPAEDGRRQGIVQMEEEEEEKGKKKGKKEKGMMMEMEEGNGQKGGGEQQLFPQSTMIEAIGRKMRRRRAKGRNGRRKGSRRMRRKTMMGMKEEEGGGVRAGQEEAEAIRNEQKVADGRKEKMEEQLEEVEEKDEKEDDGHGKMVEVGDGHHQQQQQQEEEEERMFQFQAPSDDLPIIGGRQSRRLSPYWAADQLERIFHLSTTGHPRPAPPTENGELRIGPDTGGG